MSPHWPHVIRAALQHGSASVDEDVVEELAQHAEAMHERALAEGCSREAADRMVAAHIERWRHDARELRRHSSRPLPVTAPPVASRSSLAGLTDDVRYAVRLARRSPRQTLLAIATVAIGIGMTTLLFSVTHGVLLKPLPWPNADRLVALRETRGGHSPRFGSLTNAAYLGWRDEHATTVTMAAWTERQVTLTGLGEPERIQIIEATSTLFSALGMRPLLGSFFTGHEEKSRVVVLSERLWKHRFGANPEVLGSRLRLDGQPYTVVGVLPEDVAYPDRQVLAVVPMAVPPVTSGLSMLEAIALLGPGITPTQAFTEGTARAHAASASSRDTAMALFGSDGPVEITGQTLREALVGEVRRPILILFCAVFLLLAVATANVASLQLARATMRRRELAIRAALGAGAARIARQFVAEALILATVGGAAGLAFAVVLHWAVPAMLPADFPHVDAIGIDVTVVAFALVLSLSASIACALWTLLHIRRIDLARTLGDNGLAVGAGLRSRTARSRLVIMAGQVALTCVLLIGASLLGRSVFALVNAERGYDLTGVMSARLSMPSSLFPAPERRFALLDTVLTRLSGAPGVSVAAFTSELPLIPGGSTGMFTLVTSSTIVHGQASPRIVSPGYFTALGISTIAGRTFTDSDTGTSELVVVVNRTFAEQFLGSGPIGVRVPLIAYAASDGDPPEATVIGVVEDVRYVIGAVRTQPELYYSYRQIPGGLPVQTVTLLARTAGGWHLSGEALRTAAREADARLIADRVMPLEDRLFTMLARPQFYAVVLAVFAASALVIAGVGLVGVLSYSVSLRARELAIRAALGAGQADLLRLVLRQGLIVTAAGICVGLLASLWLMRALASQLYGITSHDPVTFLLVPLFLLAAGMGACLAPALRAANLDAPTVLRSA